MGAADCEVCAAMGHRTCDRCGRPFHPGYDGGTTAFGFELCVGCGGPGAVEP